MSKNNNNNNDNNNRNKGKPLTELLNKIPKNNNNNNNNNKNKKDLTEMDFMLDSKNILIEEDILDSLMQDLENLAKELEDARDDNNDPNRQDLILWEQALAQESMDFYRSDSLIEIPIEFYDILEVMRLGATKYGADSYLEPSNKSMLHKNNTASMFRHLAEHHMGVDKDLESGVDPLLHLACRALMAYTRKQRGIVDDHGTE